MNSAAAKGETSALPPGCAIAATRKAMAGEDAADLRSAVDELSSLTYKMTENLYAELEGGESG
ncbi:MAG: hypothetical protein ACE5GX_20185 [Thermoanaerobaculia bacterium]